MTTRLRRWWNQSVRWWWIGLAGILVLPSTFLYVPLHEWEAIDPNGALLEEYRSGLVATYQRHRDAGDPRADGCLDLLEGRWARLPDVAFPVTEWKWIWQAKRGSTGTILYEQRIEWDDLALVQVPALLLCGGLLTLALRRRQRELDEAASAEA